MWREVKGDCQPWNLKKCGIIKSKFSLALTKGKKKCGIMKSGIDLALKKEKSFMVVKEKVYTGEKN